MSGYASITLPKKFLTMHPTTIYPIKGGLVIFFKIGLISYPLNRYFGNIYPLSTPIINPPIADNTNTIMKGPSYSAILYYLLDIVKIIFTI